MEQIHGVEPTKAKRSTVLMRKRRRRFPQNTGLGSSDAETDGHESRQHKKERCEARRFDHSSDSIGHKIVELPT
jgi:hypothetical protein